MEEIQPYLNYFEQHPTLAIIVIFLIAFGEALLVIGLFVPSTVVLVGAGVLVGSGHLSFWPVFFATMIGAFAGDQVSYWAGRMYGDKLKTFWPLNRYPQLLAKGEAFVSKHGGKSIAIGRFVPGVKAVVPGIVGMLGMGQTFFFTVNFLSSIVWSIAHIFPGILAGQGLALAGDLSGRLALVLIEVLVILAVAGWLIRLLASSLAPYFHQALRHISQWAKRQSARPLRRLGRALAPESPRATLVVFFSVLTVLGLLSFIFIATGVVQSKGVATLDNAVMMVMRSLRNAPADAFMIPLTMMGDAVVIIPVMLTIVGWLLWQRAWQAAIAASLVFIVGKFISTLLKLGIHRARPEDVYTGLEAYSFPSGHTTSAALTFGVLAVLVTRFMNRWTGSLVHVTCGLIVIMIAYTRIYLGVHWFSDTLGGLCYGLLIVAIFGIAVEALPLRRIKPWGLFAAALLVFATAGLIHVKLNLPAMEKFYTPAPHVTTISAQQWQTAAWQILPKHRIDIASKTEEAFSLQWAGNLQTLESDLQKHGWVASPHWSWRDSLSYLNLHLPLEKLAPRPALHQGLQAKLTMTLQAQLASTERLVLRAYRADDDVALASGLQPIYLVSITNETLVKKLGTYVIPELSPLRPDQWQAIKQQIQAMPQIMLHEMGPEQAPLLQAR